jgi:hypothetical protein
VTEAPETDFGETQKTCIQGAFDLSHQGRDRVRLKTEATAAVKNLLREPRLNLRPHDGAASPKDSKSIRQRRGDVKRRKNREPAGNLGWQGGMGSA